MRNQEILKTGTGVQESKSPRSGADDLLEKGVPLILKKIVRVLSAVTVLAATFTAPVAESSEVEEATVQGELAICNYIAAQVPFRTSEHRFHQLDGHINSPAFVYAQVFAPSGAYVRGCSGAANVSCGVNYGLYWGQVFHDHVIPSSTTAITHTP